jgi:hypothetical protein
MSCPRELALEEDANAVDHGKLGYCWPLLNPDCIFGLLLIRFSQCDELRPICGRCSKSGMIEPCNYPDRADLIFRDQNTQAAREAMEKWRSRSTKKSRISSDSDKKTDSGSSQSPPAIASLSNSDDFETVVVQRFFFDWAITSKGETVGLLGFMPDLHAGCKPGSLLSKAVKAVAYANYAQRFHAVEARQPAIANCTAALGILQTEMERPADDRVHETLLSIILLGLYEVCTL